MRKDGPSQVGYFVVFVFLRDCSFGFGEILDVAAPSHHVAATFVGKGGRQFVPQPNPACDLPFRAVHAPLFRGHFDLTKTCLN